MISDISKTVWDYFNKNFKLNFKTIKNEKNSINNRVIHFRIIFRTEERKLSAGRYHSICCGTPSDKPVMNFIKQFQKKNKIKNFEMYKQSGLGREGEFNIYIGTDTFSRTKKTKFVEGLKAAINTQNQMKRPNRDGNVSFDETTTVKKANLSMHEI
jgi:hypothetical protein